MNFMLTKIDPGWPWDLFPDKTTGLSAKRSLLMAKKGGKTPQILPNQINRAIASKELQKHYFTII
jgi:hypothetical protein